MRTTVPVAAVSFFVCGMVACSTVACNAPPAKKSFEPPPAPVKDDTALLPFLNRTGARVVPNHLLGKSQLPGGTIGDYDAGGMKYQLFIIETPSAQDAAIMLLDLKVSLRDPAYIAWMGGYSGTDAGKVVYVFAKSGYLAGVVGLPDDLADVAARELAAHLY